MQGQKVSQRVDGQMDLRPLLAFGPIVTGPFAALGCRAQGPAIKDGRARLRIATGGQAQQRAQIIGQLLEAPGRQLALRLLVDGLPGWKVVGHPPPWRARLHHIAQPVEHLAERMLALPCILAQQRQVGGDKRPFVIGNVGGIARA